ncbi:hypothetical protein LOD99_10949 [Oopsacas minuta]|uniref:Reverse transcriptase domain-containing protein n=1 Tax=Oopsacas minuta TaxID=111878 RepID=A0AAV7KB29_9METZ|nr:hypothetical protein LOD99_10949 [Oopsacas minuta]
MYFKIKTHKPTSITHSTEYPEIYTYTNEAKNLVDISRPIINHKNTITSCASKTIRNIITPIIQLHPYLTQDIFETISELSKPGTPEHIYTADIEAFYPNTPHDLVLTAFYHFIPGHDREMLILKELLNFNFTTNGDEFFHLGNVGIPMGLPIAPELARLCTAYLLNNYRPPPGNLVLTIYFDDLAATFPVMDLPLGPYTLKETAPNATQDCIYDTQTKTFKPITQQYRQPVLLHPQSYHPRRKMCKNTYQSSAFRASKIATNPADALDHLLRRYLPSLKRLGHNLRDVTTKLVNICYFPTRTDKEPFEFKPILKYTYSQTRPTKSQLHHLEITDYHLIPNIPLALLKGQLCYQMPKSTHNHNYIHCPSYTCRMCNNYETLASVHLSTPLYRAQDYACCTSCTMGKTQMVSLTTHTSS